LNVQSHVMPHLTELHKAVSLAELGELYQMLYFRRSDYLK
jgi:hypothetical protein